MLKNVTLSIAAVIASLLAIEAGLRIFYSELPDRVAYGAFLPDRELGAVPHPGYHDLSISINEWGMRDRSRPRLSPSGGLRVIVLGDSFVFGGERQDETIVSFLEAILQQSFPGRTVEVLNGGVPGYDTIQEAAWYRRFARPLGPHVVVLALYIGNDLEDNLDHRPQSVHRGRLVSQDELKRLRAADRMAGEASSYLAYLVEAAEAGIKAWSRRPAARVNPARRSNIHRMLEATATPGPDAARGVLSLAHPLPADPLIGPDAETLDPERLYSLSPVPAAAFAERLAEDVRAWAGVVPMPAEHRRRIGMTLAIEGTIEAARVRGWVEPAGLREDLLRQVERFSSAENVPDIGPALEATRPALGRLAANVAADGARFAVVLIPSEIQVEHGLASSLKRRRPDLPDRWEPHWPLRRAVSLCRSMEIRVLDTFPEMAAWARRQPLYLRYDTHLNAAGAFLVADLIAGSFGDLWE
ncbi:MAG: SGNH/GDSL hydrolase family protein [Deltaproteobacteria bacterium]|nr:SGNH/GDSL hydrolase family protein [Deltaproteobacteria bacterium]